MKEIVKEVVVNNYTLSFVRYDKDEKIVMESDNETVKKWISNVRHKRLDEQDIPYVVKAFSNAMNSGNPEEYMQLKQLTKPNMKPIRDLNEWVQYRFRTNPTWSFSVDNMIPRKTMYYAELKLPNGTIYEGSGTSKDWAKLKAAEKFWEDVKAGAFDYSVDDDEE